MTSSFKKDKKRDLIKDPFNQLVLYKISYKTSYITAYFYNTKNNSYKTEEIYPNYYVNT